MNIYNFDLNDIEKSTLERINNDILVLFNNAMDSQKEDFYEEIRVWLAELSIFGKHMELQHSNDPPWDSSGKLVYSGDRLGNVSKTVSELLHNYNGEEIPSFQSGSGFYHNRCEDELLELAMEFTFDIYNKVSLKYLQSILPNILNGLKKGAEIPTDQKDINKLLNYFSLQLSEQFPLDDHLVFTCPNELVSAIVKFDLDEIIHSYRNGISKQSDLTKIKNVDAYHSFLRVIKNLKGTKKIKVFNKIEELNLKELRGDEAFYDFLINEKNDGNRNKHSRFGTFDLFEKIIRQRLSLVGFVYIEMFDGENDPLPYEVFGINLANNSWKPCDTELLKRIVVSQSIFSGIDKDNKNITIKKIPLT